ncbi:MAG: hypothetical protein ACE5GQ_05425 [Nitrospinales bacterium]
MFYDVRILDSNMKLKKTINSRQLAQMHWEEFYRREKGKKFAHTDSGSSTSSLRKRLKL